MAEEVDFVPLTHEVLCSCLSQVELTVEGGGFAFTTLDCSGKELTDLGNKVENYKQLRHVVVSNNRFTDISKLTQLPHLLTLVADNNEVTSAASLEEATLQWCQRLDLSVNKLTTLPALRSLERLRFASFAGNELASLTGFGGHAVLEALELQDNQLSSLEGLGTLERLRSLNLSGNQVASLQGLDTPCLERLLLGKNQLMTLEHVGGAPKCRELEVSENQLPAEEAGVVELRRLGESLPRLRALSIGETPLAQGLSDGLRAEVLVYLPQLTRLEDEAVTDEDREAAEARVQEIREAAEAAAAEAEAAARAAAEGGEDGEAEEEEAAGEEG